MIRRQPLRRRQLAFVDAFLANGGNATAAALAAGYAESSAAVTGHHLLRQDVVAALIVDRCALAPDGAAILQRLQAAHRSPAIARRVAALLVAAAPAPVVVGRVDRPAAWLDADAQALRDYVVTQPEFASRFQSRCQAGAQHPENADAASHSCGEGTGSSMRSSKRKDI